MFNRLLLVFALCLGLPSFALAQDVSTTGAQIRAIALASGVTTDTTSALAIAVPNGIKTFYGQVVCSSGACVQTQAIYGATSTVASNGVLICTITLSATTRDQAACSPVTSAFPFYYVVTTATSGTSATGGIHALY